MREYRDKKCANRGGGDLQAAQEDMIDAGARTLVTRSDPPMPDVWLTEDAQEALVTAISLVESDGLGRGLPLGAARAHSRRRHRVGVIVLRGGDRWAAWSA